MPDTFAPLAVPKSTRQADATFRLKVIPQAANTAPAFKPLQPAPKPSAAPSAPGDHTAHSVAPKVTLQREGDRVTHIRLECGCGEVFELACVY